MRNDEIPKVVFNAQKFVFETPLYERVKFDSTDPSKISDLVNKKIVIDGYCAYCKRLSVFHSQSTIMKSDTNLDSRFSGLQKAELICQRARSHQIVIFTLSRFEDEKQQIIVHKIGQTPSHADISNSELNNLSDVLQGVDRKEFGTANGLAAHGVNIGAFVYLRRLFERLVQRAKDRAPTSIDEAIFYRAKMVEKIEILKEQLPPFLGEHKQIYSILSRGIHELDEDSCGNFYAVLRESCLLMLRQEKELLDKKKHETELSKLIQGISEKLR